MTSSPNPEGPRDPEEPPARGNRRGGPGGIVAQLGGQQNVLGIISALAGILGLCCGPCLGGFSSGSTYFFELPLPLAAIVLGVLHLQRVNKGAATNRNLAIVGIILGVVGLILAICLGATSTGASFHNDVG